jgi:capsular polysaccharide biosynthesis protein
MDTSGGSDLDNPYHEPGSSSAEPGQCSRDGSRGILNRLVRRLPQIILVWLVISMPAVYLAYLLVEPTYDASSILRIEPSPDLFGPSAKGDDASFGQYLETQRALILSNRVLEPAIAKVIKGPGYHPSHFPDIRDSTDRKADVRKRLRVNVIPGTYLIQITFSSPSAIEAAEVVNQVVSAFEQENVQFNEGMNGVLRTNLEHYVKKLDGDIKNKQKEMIALAERLESQVSKPTTREDDARPTSRADELRITFIRDELSSLNGMKDSVKRKLEKLQFESRKEGAPRVYVVDPAAASKSPRTDSRIGYLMSLPLGVLTILLGFFVVLEARVQPPRPALREPDLP